MLKVLIIDDEPIIREGIKSIINWEKYGFSVCGEAVNGQDGLQKILDLDPDLAIVDIKMPVMDGLKMVEELRKQENYCKIIFLTAYSDFKYAQKAVELGIESYVLKPIEQNELVEKVCNTHEAIMHENKTQEFIDESISLSKDKILENLVHGQFDIKLTEKYNKLYGFNFPWKNYQVILIDLNNIQNNSISLKYNVKREVENFISENNYGFVFNIEKFIGILFKDVYLKSHLRVLTHLKKIIIEKCGVDCIISLGVHVANVIDVFKSYNNAYELMEKKFIYGHKKIIMDLSGENPLKFQDKAINNSFSLEGMLNNLYNAVDVNNMDYINDLLEELRYQFIINEYSEEAIKVNYTNLYTALVNKIKVGDMFLGDNNLDLNRTLDGICKASSLQELHGFIKYTITCISDELLKQRPSNYLQKILDYIDRNFNKNIKLETLASLFNYNSAYLGTLFKSYSGMPFNKYLDLVRIKKAKEFLKDGEKVSNAAEKSGYKDIDYFYKKFKKYEGISPSEYKEKCKNSI